jgi:hypothetical protein
VANALAPERKGLIMSLPKATAVWLIDETALTFKQISEFCGISPDEVQAIADGELAQDLSGYDPVANKQVTAEDIARCEANPEMQLELIQPCVSHHRAGGAGHCV